MTCQEIMTVNPSCCLPSDTASDAARVMKMENVGPVPVISDRNTRRLTGIITDRDIAVKVAAEGRNPNSVQLKEIMSTELVSCRPGDDYQQALNAMREHQVRRVPVVDDQGRLTGIISQADIARRIDEREAGEIVEDISRPEKPNSMHMLRHRSWSSGGNRFSANSAIAGGLSIGLGAGLMYLLDPDRGRRRRAIVRDKAASLYKDTERFMAKAGRDLRNRTGGLVSEAKSMFERRTEAVPDNKLAARVRSHLGRLVSHPSAVQVTVKDGCVSLEGPILNGEVERLLSDIRGVPGVCRVDDRLKRHANGNSIPGLQGGHERRRQPELLQKTWTPGIQALASAAGGLLAVYAAVHRSTPKSTAEVSSAHLSSERA